MSPIAALGCAATFLAGVAAALLASYPIPENSTYVCFVALFFALAACLAGGCAILLHTSKRERLRLERVVDLTVDALERRQGLGAVRHK